MVEEEKPLSFEEIWEMTGEDGNEYEDYARKFFDVAKKLNLPQELIVAFVGVCRRADMFEEYYNDIFADKESLQKINQKLRDHYHLPSGEAVIKL